MTLVFVCSTDIDSNFAMSLF